MQYRKNLEFQHKHFPQVYRQYVELSSSAGKRPTKKVGTDQDIVEKIRDEIIIICQDYAEILRVFRLPYRMQKLLPPEIEDYAIVRIESAYVEKILASETQKEVQLQFHHGYYSNCRIIVLAKSPSKAIIQNVAKIIVMRELDFFAGRLLRDYDCLNVAGGVAELRKTLSEFKLGYDETKFLSGQLQANQEEVAHYPRFLENQLESVLSLDICRILNDLLRTRAVNQEDCRMIMEKYTQEFEKMALELLNRLIIDADFTKNFWLVNYYIAQLKAFEKEVLRFISDSLFRSFTLIRERFEKEAQAADIYNALLESNIEKLDVILRRNLELLYDQILVLIGKVQVI